MARMLLKKCRWLLPVVLVVLFFSACGAFPTKEAASKPGQESPDKNKAQEAEAIEPEEPGFLPDDFRGETEIFEDRYYYRNLTEDEQLIYAYLYQKIADFSEQIMFRKEVDSIAFHKSYYALLQDCPELFWVNSNLKITTMDQTNNVTTVFVLFEEVSKEEVKEQQAAIEEISSQWISEIDPGLSEYEKVKTVFEMIVERVDYIDDAQYNQDIRSVFLDQESVCSGYSKAMQYLLTKLDVFCTLANGKVVDGLPHCWNLVCIDGTYTWVDVTQGDASEGPGIICYGYLCFDDEVLNRSYSIEKNIELSTMPDQEKEYFTYPPCDSDAYNYFKLQGRSYDVYDPALLEDYIVSGVGEGRSVFAFQFTTEEAYNQAVAALADESLMNAVLTPLLEQGSGQVWQYTYGDDPRIYTIYIEL